FETTGLPDFPAPSEAPHQPHIVQAAAALVNLPTRKLLAGFNLIAKPDGWTIPTEVSAIHGITDEIALTHGVPEQLIVENLLALWRVCDFRVAHNESFDARIMRIGLKRFGFSDELADQWKAAPAKCTAAMSTPYCNIAPTEKMVATGRRYPKKPKL